MWHQITFNLIPSILKSEKNWAIDEILKINFPTPIICGYFPFYHYFRGYGFVFWNCVNWSFFLGFWNRWHQIVRKSNPLIYRYQNDLVSTRLGGGSPWTFRLQLTPKKLLICKLRGSIPLMWWIQNHFGSWILGNRSSEQFGAICFKIREKIINWHNFKKQIRIPENSGKMENICK